MRRIAPAICFFVALALSASAAMCQVAQREGFEGPQVVWRDAGGDASYRIETLERTTQTSHTGNSSEFVSVVATAGNGTSVYLSYDIGRAPVIREFIPSVWVLADRPGVQLSARVVFPRTRNPANGQPLTAVLPGAGYTRVGSWQQLQVTDVVAAMQQQALLLRAQSRLPVDSREAYVDQLLLNVYGGPGRTRVWIDDLEVQGVLATPAAGTQPQADPASFGRDAPQPGVSLSGTTLQVDGRPVFPRVIEYQGEPLELLSRLGFNAVRLNQPATPAILAEADRAGIWLVCPPPTFLLDQSTPQPLAAPTRLGPEYRRVLAWDLGRGLTSAELQATRDLAERTRGADPQRRLIFCQAENDLRAFSRYVDALCTEVLPLGTSFQLADFGKFVQERARLARPGTPTWTTIQTQPADVLGQQVALLTSGTAPPMSVQPEQIRLLVYEAVAAGARGLVFASRSPLSSEDQATQARAAMLELLNLELELIEPWTATGGASETIPGSDKAVRGALLRAERGVLLLPIWSGPDAQHVPGQLAGAGITFIVPGVPDPNEVYEITPGGLRPLKHQRMAGGMNVTVDEFSLTSQVVMTQDGLLISGLTQRLQRNGARMVALERELANMSYLQVADIHSALAPFSTNPAWEGDVQQRLGMAQTNLQMADTHTSGGDMAAAHLQCRRALRALSIVARDDWQRAVQVTNGPLSNPATALLTSMPLFPATHRTILNVPRWQMVLPEGDVEDLQRMLSAGWRHFQHVQDGVQSDADLSLETRHNPLAPGGQPQTAEQRNNNAVQRIPGQRCLHMVARAVDERAAAGMVESPPLWITSPAVNVQAGQLVRISGWVNVPEPVNGSLDGLLVFDSLGGPEMARRFGPTKGWEQFIVFRAAPESGSVSLTIALTGFGEAWIDDLEIAVPGAGPAQPLPAPRAAVDYQRR